MYFLLTKFHFYSGNTGQQQRSYGEPAEAQCSPTQTEKGPQPTAEVSGQSMMSPAGLSAGTLMLNENQPGGDAQEKVQNPADALVNLIQSLSIEPDDVELMPVSDAAKKFVTNKSEMETFVSMLYNRCLTNWKFARCAALLCQRIISIQVEQNSLRTMLLQTIQKAHKEKDELRATEPHKFLGCLSFLCQVLATFRDANNQPFLPLVKPVYNSIEQLLDSKATEEEMQCAAFHLGRCL